jgi:DNA-binding MltR family transcriptional regulator
MPSAERESEANHLAYLAQDLNADIEELAFIEDMALRRLSALDAVTVEATGVPPRLIFDMPGFQVRFQPAPALENPAQCSLIYAATTMSTLDGSRHAYNALIREMPS